MSTQKPIGVFQKWNTSADRPEWSFTRVIQAFMALYFMYFDWYYLQLLKDVNDEIKITFNFIFLNLVFLIAIFYPKYLKDLIDLKDRITGKK